MLNISEKSRINKRKSSQANNTSSKRFKKQEPPSLIIREVCDDVISIIVEFLELPDGLRFFRTSKRFWSKFPKDWYISCIKKRVFNGPLQFYPLRPLCFNGLKLVKPYPKNVETEIEKWEKIKKKIEDEKDLRNIIVISYSSVQCCNVQCTNKFLKMYPTSCLKRIKLYETCQYCGNESTSICGRRSGALNNQENKLEVDFNYLRSEIGTQNCFISKEE